MSANVQDWILRHSDAFHPGPRETCDHCQEMIKAFGEMPPAEEIQAASRIALRNSKTKGWQKHPITDHIRWKVWERDNFTCRHCGGRTYLAVDHVIAESKGGKLEIENLQTLCRKCNSRKGAR